MTVRRTALAAIAAGALTLTACSGGNDTDTVTKTVTAPAEASETTAPIPAEVTRVLDALDELDADYTDPVEDDPGELSGAERTFELDIVDYSAGINMFATADDLDVWQEASDDFGGVSVTFGTTAVSLNSDEGKDASLALAPQLAEKLAGEAHTGGEEPDYTPSGETNEEASAQRSIWAPTGQGTQCPGTDAYVWDYADCNPSNGVIDPDEFYRIIGEQEADEARRAEVEAYNAEVDAHSQRVAEYDAAWVQCLGDINRPDYYEQEAYCRSTIPEP